MRNTILFDFGGTLATITICPSSPLSSNKRLEKLNAPKLEPAVSKGGFEGEAEGVCEEVS
jgi:hypothetical protein